MEKPFGERLDDGPGTARSAPLGPEPACSAATVPDQGVDTLPGEDAVLRPASEPEPRPCPHCSAVTPPGAQSCPTCHLALPGNSLALKHGLRSVKLTKQVDAYRIELLAELLRERGGRDALAVVDRISCENFALLCAQHKILEERIDEGGPLTTKGSRRAIFDMLRQLTESIDKLRKELPPVVVTPDAEAQLTDGELIARAEALIEIVRAAAEATRTAAPRPHTTMTPPAEPAESIKTAPEPVPTCQFCYRQPASCDALKRADLNAWRTLHLSHPSEVERRDAEATAEMRESLRRRGPARY